MRIVVTGSIAYDYIMSFPGDFSEHILPEKIDVLSVSFLVESLRREPGGCAANIAYNLALLGETPSVMATVGADFAADRQRLEALGVDLSLSPTLEDESTASFFVSTDQKNRQIASFYVGAMGAAERLSFGDLARGSVDLAVIAPNAPAAMVKYARECREMGIPYVYDPSQQIVRLSGEELKAGIEGCACFVANEYEYELVHGKTGLSEDDIAAMTRVVVITHGEKGSVIRADGEAYAVPAVPAREEVDPTGIGDAYRSGIMFGLLHDLPWPVAGRLGALAATYALESLGTQSHSYDVSTFTQRYEEHFGERPQSLIAALGRAEQQSRAGLQQQGATR